MMPGDPVGDPGIDPVVDPAFDPINAGAMTVVVDELENPELTGLLARFAALGYVPSVDRQGLMDDLIENLISTGVWAKLDVLKVYACGQEASSLLNWIADANNSLAVNFSSSDFSVDAGFTSDGLTKWINSGYNPSLGTNYLLNSASFGVWYLNDVAASNRFSHGVTIPLAEKTWLKPGSDTIPGAWALNSGIQAQASATQSGTSGFHLVTRNNATNCQYYKDGVLKLNASQASTTIPNGFMYELGHNYKDATPYNVRDITEFQIAVSFAGGGLTAQNVTDLNDNLNTYLSGLGAI